MFGSALVGEKPKFHFAHFLIPHPPFMTHGSGRCMKKTEARAQNYRGQLIYANAGDEVLAFGRGVFNVDWRELAPADLKEKMAIFSAIYAPRIQPASWHSEITPVNTFRLILRDYFNVAIEPLPDRLMVYESADNLYHFMDVTEILYSP